MIGTRKRKSTLVSWIAILGIGAAIVIALILSLPAPPGPHSQGGGVLTGTVQIAPALASKIAPGDVLFVIARRGPGPPLAVKRIADPAFPVAFRLGPEDRVMGEGQFEGAVSVIARVAKGGAAGPARPGDLEGSYAHNPVTIGGAPIDIVIDRER